jgi:hypothetical protein
MIAFEKNRSLMPRRLDWRRDLTVAGALVALTIGLLAWWNPGLDLHLAEVAKPMASRELLMALAMLIALRMGVIDLSVWVLPGICALVGGTLVNAGVPSGWAMLVAVVFGAMLGLVKAGLVFIPRVPAVVMTLVMGLAGVWVARMVWPAPVTVGVDTFQSWLMAKQVEGDLLSLPLSLTRILLVLSGFLLAMTVCLGPLTAPRARGGGLRSVLGLTCAGALLGLAGVCQLLDSHMAAAPVRVVGDFRVLASVVLAGGVLFVGHGRDRLAGLCLPMGMLAATLWGFAFADGGRYGYEWQVLWLAVGAGVFQVITRCVFRGQPGSDLPPIPE